MPGYSPNPLATKLGIKEGMTVATVGAPKEFETWLAPLPAKVRLTTRGGAAVPILLCFVTRREDLEARLPTLLARVLPPRQPRLRPLYNHQVHVAMIVKVGGRRGDDRLLRNAARRCRVGERAVAFVAVEAVAL